MAADSGVSVLAISDHDSVEALPAAVEAAEKFGVTLIPAVELSANLGEYDLHILGYFIDYEDAALATELARLRQSRHERAEVMVDLLKEAGFDLSVEDVLRFSEGGAVGRSHVAKALVERGAASTVREAFERLIGHGRPFYVPKAALTPAESIALVHAAGGLAVIAHPGVNQLPEQLLLSLIALGLDGVEAYHADHDEGSRAYFAQFAAEHGLLVTGGTDYHGPTAPNPVLGSVDVPEYAIRALLARGGL